MRRMWIIGTCCVVLLFVPIYLWQVNGWPSFWPFGSHFDSKIAPQKPETMTSLQMEANEIEQLAKTDPIALLKHSQAHYQKHIRSYTCTLTKRERIHGKLRPREVIDVWFQDEPFSVLMVWKEGKDRAAASLYSVTEKKDKLFVRPAGDLERTLVSLNGGSAQLAPDDAKAKATARYLITEFGIQQGTERTRKAWEKIQQRGLMNFKYRDDIKICEPAGNRPCHVITRYCDPATEDDIREREEGLTEVTIFIDTETLLHIGTILKAKDEIIGEYYFSNIVINPTFSPTQFKPEILRQY